MDSLSRFLRSFLPAVLIAGGVGALTESIAAAMIAGMVVGVVTWGLVDSADRRRPHCPDCHGILPDAGVKRCQHCGAAVAAAWVPAADQVANRRFSVGRVVLAIVLVLGACVLMNALVIWWGS